MRRKAPVAQLPHEVLHRARVACSGGGRGSGGHVPPGHNGPFHGGHGALTIALRKPGHFKAVSAFAPICSPMRCPWGKKALAGDLGPDRNLWRAYDATALIQRGACLSDLLVDQGTADGFLETSQAGISKKLEKGGRSSDLADAGRLRRFLLLHRELYRGPPALARREVKA